MLSPSHEAIFAPDWLRILSKYHQSVHHNFESDDFIEKEAEGQNDQESISQDPSLLPSKESRHLTWKAMEIQTAGYEPL